MGESMSQRLLINMAQMDIVRRIPLFAGLTEEEKDILLQGGGIYSYPRKKCIFREDDPVKYLYIVCAGIVQEFHETHDGHEITVNIYKMGDVFCTTGLFSKDSLHHTNTIAVDNAYVMELPIEKFKENIRKYESITAHLFSSLVQLIVMKQLEVEQQATMSSTQILAFFLRQVCDSYGLDPHGFTLPYKKSLIASRLGMELETLSRAIPKLKAHGIEVKGVHVRFTDLPVSAENVVRLFPASINTRKRAYA
jgi:CRP-like cAMP-binding protein